jgi:hypothetical protein
MFSRHFLAVLNYASRCKIRENVFAAGAEKMPSRGIGDQQYARAILLPTTHIAAATGQKISTPPRPPRWPAAYSKHPQQKAAVLLALGLLSFIVGFGYY